MHTKQGRTSRPPARQNLFECGPGLITKNFPEMGVRQGNPCLCPTLLLPSYQEKKKKKKKGAKGSRRQLWSWEQGQHFQLTSIQLVPHPQGQSSLLRQPSLLWPPRAPKLTGRMREKLGGGVLTLRTSFREDWEEIRNGGRQGMLRRTGKGKTKPGSLHHAGMQSSRN